MILCPKSPNRKITQFNSFKIITKILLIFCAHSIHRCEPSNEFTPESHIENLNPLTIPTDEYKNPIQNLTKCNLKVCDSIGGECIDKQTCKCKDRFTSLLRNGNIKLCNYEKKNSIVAAFLELFLGFGLGHIYSERKILGIFKFLLSSLLCCIGCCALAIGMKLDADQRQQRNSITMVFLFIYACIFNFLVLWQIIDFIFFIFKIYTDGNNVPLY